jgi:hypothetical protein
MFNFSVGTVLGRPMLKPLVDALPNRPRCADVDNVFAAPYERAEEFMRVYALLEQARRHDTASVLAAQLEADELITSLGHRLQHDLGRYASLPGRARRVAIGSLVSHPWTLLTPARQRRAPRAPPPPRVPVPRRGLPHPSTPHHYPADSSNACATP